MGCAVSGRGNRESSGSSTCRDDARSRKSSVARSLRERAEEDEGGNIDNLRIVGIANVDYKAKRVEK